MLHLVPNSNGEDNAPLREYNVCHNPEGPGGGQFCSSKHQVGVRSTPIPPASVLALQQLGDADKQLAFLQKHHPTVVAEAEALIERGRNGHAEFREALTDIADKLGYKLHDNIESRDILDRDVDWVVVGPVKGLRRTATKAALDYDGDVSKVKDILRGTIAVRDPQGMVDALSKLSNVAHIINIKDHVSQPMDSGYRDLNVLVRMKRSELLAEMQILTKPMLEAKMTRGHRLYEMARSLAPDSAAYQQLLQQQVSLYSTAWSKAGGAVATIGALAALVPRIRGGV